MNSHASIQPPLIHRTKAFDRKFPHALAIDSKRNGSAHGEVSSRLLGVGDEFMAKIKIKDAVSIHHDGLAVFNDDNLLSPLHFRNFSAPNAIHHSPFFSPATLLTGERQENEKSSTINKFLKNLLCHTFFFLSDAFFSNKGEMLRGFSLLSRVDREFRNWFSCSQHS